MKLGQWLGLSSLVISGYILWEIRQLLLLVFTAVVFATVLNRLVKWLSQFHIRQITIERNIAVVIILLVISLLTTLFFLLIVPPFIGQFYKFIELSPIVWEKIRDILMSLEHKQFKLNSLFSPSSLVNFIEQLQPLFSKIFSNFFAFFSNSVSAIFQLFFVLVLTVMIAINPQAYRKILLKISPSFYRHRVDKILTLSEIALGNWLMGITINCLFVGILSGVGLLVLQVKLVLVHALLAGLLNFIPNIGPASSVIFPIMVALLDEPWKIWAILLWYFIIQNIESYWLTPIIMAKQVSLLPAVTLMAQIFFAQSFGLLGLLLALPLTVVAKTWIDEVLFKDILDSWVE
ncbi:AI-2E family transporter [Cyanobacterium sp. uoEpiScrs1]|uniref:AI-2E family transporter n=1 Tax=Cyanobacterium sp. uoEpiScrs1 TaxID=2976343 RepID=UPI00226A72AF|nr:AI-2E family transporter [Cyanobacterium sp. uoEpiScrs1]